MSTNCWKSKNLEKIGKNKLKIYWNLTQKWAKICKFSKNANFHYSSLLLPSVGVRTKKIFFQKLPWHVLITLESKNNNIFPKYRFAVVRGFKNLKVVCPYIRCQPVLVHSQLYTRHKLHIDTLIPPAIISKNVSLWFTSQLY